jgi:hypothetical protein
VQKVRNFERKKDRKLEPCPWLCELPSNDWSRVKRNREQTRVGALNETSEDRTITHKTIHITPKTLLSSIDEWISSRTETYESQHLDTRGQKVEQAGSPVPVLFVALHACGSLTPDIIRAFLSSYREVSSDGTGGKSKWVAAGLLVVGCCYNLMAPSGRPSNHPLV